MRVYGCKFSYNGINSTEMNVMTCDIDGNTGLIETPSGSALELSTVKPVCADKWHFYNAQYSEPLSYSIHLMKTGFTPFTVDEITKINRWLMRKDGYHPFSFTDSAYGAITFFATAVSGSIVSSSNKNIALKYDFKTNAPFGYGDEITVSFGGSGNFLLENTSSENGYIYPSMVILSNSNSDIEISNNGRITKIEKCLKGEKITLNNEYKIISSSNVQHDLANDFNYKWFRLSRNDDAIENNITVKGDCTIQLTYRPVIKIGVG